MIDPYATLQISRSATADDVKNAYRRLVKQLHPDLHPNDPKAAARFADVTAAYDLLSNDVRRRDYDRQSGGQTRNRTLREEGMEVFRRAWRFGAKQHPEPGTGSGAAHGRTDPNVNRRSDGRQPPGRPSATQTRSQNAQRGDDLHQTISVPFLDAIFGNKHRVVIGARAIEVVIPRLTEHGQTLRLKGQGAPPERGDLHGDALITVLVQPHPLFSRQGLDIRLTLPVSVREAVLGTVVTVPTLSGLVQLKVPAGSNTDTVLRLRGKGLRGSDNEGQGDQLVTLKTMLPRAEAADAGMAAAARSIEAWARDHAYEVREPGWEKW